MRILVVQNHHTSPLGVLGDALAERGAEPVLLHADGGEPLPADPGGYAGLVVLGGPQDAWDDRRAPWFPPLLDLIRAFAAQDRPVLGVCLGAQLAARARGARVYRHDEPEIGFHPVRLTAAARDDALLGGLGDGAVVMQWHYDTFDLPGGAVLLAEGGGLHQGFRMERGVYGFQFHLEATEAVIRDWVDRYGEEHREDDTRHVAGIADQIPRHLPAQQAFARTVGTRWADLARAAASSGGG
ncbi:type 1 glutamine amidotransferase [Azospirillum halopraeferens]|uniref:type 1 glutamine amidotransferase n=1 Tax=Azospirillum halopraeferens TaxID=34010 RepID=UPI000403670A|nr:type 1 glutamine amidotransferase [Azospirillum halopraeferens]